MSALYAEKRNHLKLTPGGDCAYSLSNIEIGVDAMSHFIIYQLQYHISSG
jgi:hypothetical protein